jgi:hypothetical protein
MFRPANPFKDNPLTQREALALIVPAAIKQEADSRAPEAAKPSVFTTAKPTAGGSSPPRVKRPIRVLKARDEEDEAG